MSNIYPCNQEGYYTISSYGWYTIAEVEKPNASQIKFTIDFSNGYWTNVPQTTTITIVCGYSYNGNHLFGKILEAYTFSANGYSSSVKRVRIISTADSPYNTTYKIQIKRDSSNPDNFRFRINDYCCGTQKSLYLYRNQSLYSTDDTPLNNDIIIDNVGIDTDYISYLYNKNIQQLKFPYQIDNYLTTPSMITITSSLGNQIYWHFSRISECSVWILSSYAHMHNISESQYPWIGVIDYTGIFQSIAQVNQYGQPSEISLVTDTEGKEWI